MAWRKATTEDYKRIASAQEKIRRRQVEGDGKKAEDEDNNYKYEVLEGNIQPGDTVRNDMLKYDYLYLGISDDDYIVLRNTSDNRKLSFRRDVFEGKFKKIESGKDFLENNEKRENDIKKVKINGEWKEFKVIDFSGYKPGNIVRDNSDASERYIYIGLEFPVAENVILYNTESNEYLLVDVPNIIGRFEKTGEEYQDKNKARIKELTKFDYLKVPIGDINPGDRMSSQIFNSTFTYIGLSLDRQFMYIQRDGEEGYYVITNYQNFLSTYKKIDELATFTGTTKEGLKFDYQAKEFRQYKPNVTLQDVNNPYLLYVFKGITIDDDAAVLCDWIRKEYSLVRLDNLETDEYYQTVDEF